MHRGHDAGFTLVEVVVALVVSTMLFGLVMNAALEAKARSLMAERNFAGAMLASNIVEERSAGAFDTSEISGEAEELNWTARELSLAADPRGFLVLSQIEVVVRDRKGKIVSRLETRKLKTLQAHD